MKALEILKRIYINNPDTRFQRNNIDINFTIHDFSNVNEAIAELEALIEKDKSKKCEECYKETNRVLTLVEQRESDAKNTTIKLIKELEALENRCCESCIHKSSNYDKSITWCINEKVNKSNLHDLIIEDDFYCNKWESK